MVLSSEVKTLMQKLARFQTPAAVYFHNGGISVQRATSARFLRLTHTKLKLIGYYNRDACEEDLLEDLLEYFSHLRPGTEWLWRSSDPSPAAYPNESHPPSHSTRWSLK